MLKELLPLILELLKDKQVRGLRNLIYAFFLIILTKICIVLMPIIYGKIIDSFYISLPFSSLALIGAYGLARFLSTVWDGLRETIVTKLVSKSIQQIYVRAMSHLHNLSHDFHLSTSSGGLTLAFQLGIRGINTLCLSSISHILPLIIEIALMLSVIIYLFGYYFSLVFTLISFLYFILAVILTKRRLEATRNINLIEMEIGSRTVDNLTNFEAIKCFNKYPDEINKLIHIWQKHVDLSVMSNFYFLKFKLIQRGVICIIIIAFLYYSFHQVAAGYMTVGQFTILLIYLTQLFDPLEGLAYEQDNVRRALIDAESMVEIMKQQPTVKETQGALPLDCTAGYIKFENVTFGYDEKRLLLKNSSCSLPAKKTIALAGRRGSGKTSIARLIMRFYDTMKGQITIDGQNITDVTLDSLRSVTSLVPQ